MGWIAVLAALVLAACALYALAKWEHYSTIKRTRDFWNEKMPHDKKYPQ